MDWWIWVLFGLVLGLAELTTPGGFYLLFFGASAIGVGILERAGIVTTPWIQWFLFSALSILAVYLLRQPMKERFQKEVPDENSDTLTGDHAEASEDISAGGTGQVALRGTTWRAENIGATLIEKGQRCHIDHVDGVTLKVSIEGS